MAFHIHDAGFDYVTVHKTSDYHLSILTVHRKTCPSRTASPTTIQHLYIMIRGDPNSAVSSIVYNAKTTTLAQHVWEKELEEEMFQVNAMRGALRKRRSIEVHFEYEVTS
jgi:hypothetical protein